MLNPDRLSAHEERLSARLDKVELQIEQLQDAPATPLNRLKLIQCQLKVQVILHSWYQKDPDETMEGLLMLTTEAQMRDAYKVCLARVTALIDKHETWAHQKVDLSAIEQWVKQPQIHT